MKRKKQEKEKKKSVQKAAQWTELIGEIQKVNNPLTKHTEPESLQKILKNTTSSFQLLYDEKYIKNCIEKWCKKSKSATIDLEKIVTWSCVSRALKKCGVR